VDKKELIYLDARLTSVIQDRAFRAELPTGHAIVAWVERGIPVSYQRGDDVTVQMSPYDMSKGRIVRRKDAADL
jgi:translation initiation factor IF-1